MSRVATCAVFSTKLLEVELVVKKEKQSPNSRYHFHGNNTYQRYTLNLMNFKVQCVSVCVFCTEIYSCAAVGGKTALCLYLLYLGLILTL